MKRWAWYLILLVGLGGCSLFGEKDTSEPPAEITDINQKVRLEQVWEQRAGSGSDDQFIRLMPAFLGDQLFVADRKGHVLALAVENGKTQWAVDTDARVSGAVGAGDGLVVFGTRDAEVVALNIRDGSEQWRSRVPSEVLSVPRIERGVVAVQTVDGTLTGLDAENGERRWVYDRTVPALTLRGTGTPAAAGGVVIAGFASGKLAALTAEQGRVAWEVVVAEPRGRSELERMVDLDADPVIFGNSVYAVTFQGQLAAVDIPGGQIEWSRDMSSFAGLGVDFSHVYVTDESSDLWALNRRNGASLWKQDALHLRGLTAPVSFDEYVAVGDFEGYVHLLSRFDGELVGRVRADGKGIAALHVVGDRLFVLGRGGSLAVYRIKADR